MELATLPRHPRQARGDGGREAGMIVADNGFDAVEATVLQAFQEIGNAAEGTLAPLLKDAIQFGGGAAARASICGILR